MKIGRNDPCHCGSGKKYKKCCLSKDSAPSPEGYKDDLASSDLGEGDEDLLIPTNSESSFYESIPDRLEEENPIVEGWWEEYESMEDADIIRAHIEKFMQNHPQL